MNYPELEKMIADAIETIKAELPAAKTPEEAKVAGFAMMGLSLVGELLLDIKRIADNGEKHVHYHVPEGYELMTEGSITVVRPIPPEPVLELERG